MPSSRRGRVDAAEQRLGASLVLVNALAHLQQELETSLAAGEGVGQFVSSVVQTGRECELFVSERGTELALAHAAVGVAEEQVRSATLSTCVIEAIRIDAGEDGCGSRVGLRVACSMSGGK